MRVAIVGNNVAGITTAKTLRDLDKDVEIAVYSEERYHYYARPMLIEFIAGKIPEPEIFFNPPEWYDRNRIAVHLGAKVEKIDPANRRLLVRGTWHGYDALVLATGARAFVPQIDGLPRRDVLTLRTLEDAKEIASRIPKTGAAAIIGGGLLGLETAGALNRAKPGMRVHVLERGGHPLQKQLDAEGGSVIMGMFREMGIDVRTDTEVKAIESHAAGLNVILKDGRRLSAQLAIISAGVRPNVELARDAGLRVGKGLVVDSALCCTAERSIYAVGDVVEHDGKTYGIIPAAMDQARIVARRILGLPTEEYSGTIPSNTLRVMGIDLTSVGTVVPQAPGYEEIRATSQDKKLYKKYILKGGKLAGAILLGTKKGAGLVQRMVKEGADVSAQREKLSDVNYDLS
ncbi:MAG: NAD(P)/FAD-dependent oxidoreductase [Euryarchaeota archaeon]|nr:NAD(P)/FAD-dependent oxidoreductase [Euryarchaeota archaeon]